MKPESGPNGTLSVMISSPAARNRYGGLTRYTHGLAQGMKQLGYDPIVIWLGEGWEMGFCVRVRAAAASAIRFWTVLPLHRRHRIAALVGVTWKSALPLVVASRLTGLPLVTIVHGSEYVRRSDMWTRSLKRWVLRRSSAVVAVSRKTASVVAQDGIPVSVVHPGVLLPYRNPLVASWSGGPGEFRVVTVARLVQRKNVEGVIRALAILQARGYPFTYTVVGSGPEEPRLRAVAAELGVPVEWLGDVPDEVLNEIYGKSHAMVLCSRASDRDFEGFGLVYLEANCHGLPVIGGRDSGAEDAVQDGITGYVVDPERPEQLAACLERLYLDPEHWRKMSSAARRWAESFLWERTASRILSHLRLPARIEPNNSV